MAGPMEPKLHTFVVSDMHLTEAEEPDPGRPLWMAYKRREFFVDDEFAGFLDHIEQKADGPIELILNGDIFDFDSVTAVPSKDRHVEWLERARGLGSEEWKSQFKMKVIIDDHPRWFEALGRVHRAREPGGLHRRQPRRRDLLAFGSTDDLRCTQRRSPIEHR